MFALPLSVFKHANFNIYLKATQCQYSLTRTLTQMYTRSGLYIRISEGPALVGVCCFSSISPPNPTFKDFFANEPCRNMLN